MLRVYIHHKNHENLCHAKMFHLCIEKKPHLTIMPGRRSKLFLIISSSSALVFFPVPYVCTLIDRGSAIPIPYETYVKSNKQEVRMNMTYVLADIKFGGACANRQTAKLSSLPN